MSNGFSKFSFPSDIRLKNSPLLEAWLEIRWQLQPGDTPELLRDPGFPFALGTFYKDVKEMFGYREDLAASHAPEDLLPYIVRHRFRPDRDKWPLLQLGPGVATVNFTHPYTWDDFEEKTLYLCEKLLGAYGEMELKTQMLALRYRNGEPFEFSSDNLLGFISQNLNTSITLPDYIPGSVSSKEWPTHASVALTYDLLEPRGTGTFRLATGTRRWTDLDTGQEEKEETLIWELEVISKGHDAPPLGKVDELAVWLSSAHAIIHEWFFSLVDGPLLRKYQGEVK